MAVVIDKQETEEEITELMPQSDMRSQVISIDPERMSGTPCFVGTRVPIQNLCDYVVSGESLDTFLDDFEGVSHDLATQALQLAFQRLLEGLPTA